MVNVGYAANRTRSGLTRAMAQVRRNRTFTPRPERGRVQTLRVIRLRRRDQQGSTDIPTGRSEKQPSASAASRTRPRLDGCDLRPQGAPSEFYRDHRAQDDDPEAVRPSARDMRGLYFCRCCDHLTFAVSLRLWYR